MLIDIDGVDAANVVTAVVAIVDEAVVATGSERDYNWVNDMLLFNSDR